MTINNSTENVAQFNEVTVAMVPWPEHGHLNPLFLLSRFIASHNIPVHFLCLTARNHDLKKRLQGAQLDDNLHFCDLSLPTTEAESSDKDMLLEKLGKSICDKCHLLSKNTKRLIIIHDCLMITYIGDLHSIPNFKCYAFHSISSFVRYSTLRQVIHIVDEDQDELIQQLGDDFPTVESTFGPHFEEYRREEREWKLSSGVITNSCRELEGKYLDSLAIYEEDNKPLWCLGPFHMLLESSLDICNNSTTQHICLEFLDKQDANSVIFVSFGTTTRFSQEQVNELALGLEQSNHKFIWVVREADDERLDKENNNCEGKDGKIVLPEGFEERVEGRGMVVRNWAPQLEILGHPSTGGFMSHCGWSSCMESISKGVPIASWPIHVDQPYNSVFITNVLRIGLSVWNWSLREETAPAAAIQKAVKTLMGTQEGEEMRQRAVELRNKIKNSVSHGGLGRKEMESFITNITNN